MKVTDILYELGDSPYKFKMSYNRDGTTAYAAPDGSIELDFALEEEEGKAVIQIFFTVNNSLEITGTGDAYKIFTTVKKIILKNYL